MTLGLPGNRRHENREGIAFSHVGEDQLPTVLLLHSIGLDSRIWGNFTDRVASMGIHVVAPDWPGHGRSSATDTPHAFSRHIRTMREAIGEVDVIVTDGEAASTGVDMALEGIGKGLILINPTPDALVAAEVKAPTEHLEYNLAVVEAAMAAGANEHDEQGAAIAFAEAVVNGFGRPYLSENDSNLVLHVIADNIDLWRNPPDPGGWSDPWSARLRDLQAPVSIAVARHNEASCNMGEILANLASNTDLAYLDAHTQFVWLEDGTALLDTLSRMLHV